MELIRKAHAFAVEHHKGQTRVSGEPYISHLREVALLATKLKLDQESIATALLHDTVEDTDVTLDNITATFGKEVADLVDGVTKLNQVKFTSREEAQAENFRKMLLAMAKDMRVLLLKLCDRTHNMRSLEFLSEARRERIAQETLDIYAPLAHRLGIYWMKSELEDLCLRFLHPAIYQNIKEKVASSKKEREVYITEVVSLLNNELKQNKIETQVSGRPKHFYSIYQKMERNNLEFDEIYDLIAFRILTGSTMDCYAALGVVHAAWKPVPGRFKDYIAMPKPNGYQSLHTTVIGPRAHRIEIQIRSTEMHEIAERGIAAHWAYKEGTPQISDKKKQLQLSWLHNLVETEKDLKDPHEFLSSVKDDLFPEEVFVFSPKGDLVSLPRGAGPIDFAYYVHTDIGQKCVGARVNGQHVPLAYKLRNGDTVEVLTSENQRPSKDWLNLVITTKAKQRIRSYIRSEERARSVVVGKETLAKDLKKIKRSLASVTKDHSLEKVASELGLKDLETLFAEIGYGKLSCKTVLTKLAPDIKNLDEQLGKEESMLKKIFQKAARALKDSSGVTVQGMDDLVFKFAKCCQPLPGEKLVGFISRGRGVVVHSRNCSQALSFDPHRLIDVNWDEKIKTTRNIQIGILCQDKIGVLAALTQTISSLGANISSAHTSPKPNGQSLCVFQVHVENSAQLQHIIRHLEKVDGVIKVSRDSFQD
ncbi:MAG TPA: bifunctional (p)ppGpp synthetase/guanosine-3',5'-bis(diphosphate) 3'-pyrophosphohydrolase [Oligoflexia bacterium]|nr:bifunctional (p)ppGpp synthetase/guanosine-3',5'-bis(diphosphate) 3'-pyrophosphohydrolase [Oligoflexia bacterium]HMP47766.1 bifunctional (p)ppGpp synthetase/guanosine-3',5'-bis(diphosphate) 3'-pyrophosphohydrolase [Oligoflexia bacterium]